MVGFMKEDVDTVCKLDKIVLSVDFYKIKSPWITS